VFFEKSSARSFALPTPVAFDVEAKTRRFPHCGAFRSARNCWRACAEAAVTHVTLGSAPFRRLSLQLHFRRAFANPLCDCTNASLSVLFFDHGTNVSTAAGLGERKNRSSVER